jgi:hypothetical protein
MRRVRNKSVMTLTFETLMQFDGEIGGHDLQKLSAEFRPSLGELSHLFQIPSGKPRGSPCDHVHWTDEAAIRADISDELSGTIREGGLVTENRFSLAGNEDNRFRYVVTPSDDYLARQEVHPPGKTRHFQKVSLVTMMNATPQKIGGQSGSC